MTSSKESLFILFIVLFSFSALQSQDLSNMTLIAHYPLSSTANDTTGHNDPMTLINTPFQEGGIYCNGNYIYGDPDSCDAHTPEISDLEFETFAVSATFRVDEVVEKRRPVFVGGINYKWIFPFIDPDTTITLGHSNIFTAAGSSGVPFTMGDWHELTFTYTGMEGMGRLYMDGVKIDSAAFVLDHNEDRAVTITQGSVGRTFKGLLKDIKIYSRMSVEQDSLALIALYNSTDGTNWEDHTNWLSGPIDTWYGITVENGRVTKADLDDNNLTGPLPSAIGNLTYVERLYLHDNNLSGTIPPEIGNLVEVDYLYLAGNQLEGAIPPEFGNLKKLNDFYLSENELTGPIPAEFANLSHMRGGLYLDDNRLTGTIPAEFGDFQHLHFLVLDDNQFEGSIPPELVNMEELRNLNIRNNRFNELPDLSGMPLLSKLYANDNQFTFEDLEPNIGIATFTYSPQDSVGVKQDTTIASGSDLELSIEVGGTANQYQWTKDGVDIPGAVDNTYTINSAEAGDAGVYECRITNTIAIELTLHSRPVTITVTETGVDEQDDAVPDRYALFPNFPNPFNPSTEIRYDLPEASEVVLKIYNMYGQEVITLVNESQTAGRKTVYWDGLDLRGQRVPSGIYVCRIRTVSFTKSHKMIKVD